MICIMRISAGISKYGLEYEINTPSVSGILIYWGIFATSVRNVLSWAFARLNKTIIIAPIKNIPGRVWIWSLSITTQAGNPSGRNRPAALVQNKNSHLTSLNLRTGWVILIIILSEHPMTRTLLTIQNYWIVR